MIYYEVELLSQPQFIFAYAVEIKHYANAFHRKKNFFELSLITSGRILYEYADGSADLVLPGMLTPIFSDLDCITKAFEKEPQCHTTVGVRADYRLQKRHSEEPTELAELTERVSSGRTLLVPFHEHLGDKCEVVSGLLARVIALANSPTPTDRARAIAAWYELCAELTAFVLDRLNKTHLSLPPSALRYVRDAKAYIAAHFKENPTVGEIAAVLGISVGYLHALFKQVTGAGVTSFLNTYRMDAACWLIAGRGLSLAEAAAQVGIEDPAYMSRLFKKTYGVTYSRYLKDLPHSRVCFTSLHH